MQSDFAAGRTGVRSLALLAVLAAGVSLLASPAGAANVVQIRIGNHPTYTRVVFELDAPAGYRVEEQGTAASPELVVTLDAASRARSIRSKSVGVAKVEVQPGPDGSVARISLRKGGVREEGVRLKEMILANPPRIVLDLMRETPKVAKAPAPKPAPKVAKAPAPKPAPAPKVAKPPKPAPEPRIAEAPKPEPKRAEPPAPVPKIAKPPAPEPKAAEPPEPKPEVVKAPTPKRPAVQPAPTHTLREPEAEPEPVAPEVAKREPRPEPTPPQTAEPKPRIARAKPETEMPEPASPPEKGEKVAPEAPAAATPRPKPPAARPEKPKAAARATAKTPPPAPAPEAEPGWLSNPIVLGAGAGVLLCLVGIVLVMRRRRPLPVDLDVSGISPLEAEAEPEPAASGVASQDTLLGGAAAAADATTSFSDLFDKEPKSAPAPPAAGGDKQIDDLFSGTEPVPKPMGDAPMNQAMSDLPAEPGRAAAPASPPAAGAAPDADVLRVVHELERRMGQLEKKLEEANEARDRLERQVAAQAEELRVQRAAIARTQRALRTMSRGDGEDKATEPALRDGDTQTRLRPGDTQAKTRVAE